MKRGCQEEKEKEMKSWCQGEKKEQRGCRSGDSEIILQTKAKEAGTEIRGGKESLSAPE